MFCFVFIYCSLIYLFLRILTKEKIKMLYFPKNKKISKMISVQKKNCSFLRNFFMLYFNRINLKYDKNISKIHLLEIYNFIHFLLLAATLICCVFQFEFIINFFLVVIALTEVSQCVLLVVIGNE